MKTDSSLVTGGYLAMRLSFAAVVLGTLALACGSAEDGTGGSAESNLNEVPAGSGASTIAPGEYSLDNDSVGARLTIKSASAKSVSYDIGVLGKTGSGHNGELANRTAKQKASGFEDVVDPDCRMAIEPAGADAVKVTQTGSCSDAGFGAFLDASGTYKKKAASSWVGLYETETTHRAWAIRVTSESPFSFRVFAGHLEDSSSRIDANGLKGELSGNKVLFEHGPDCSLELQRTELGLQVTQSGTCIAIGFPETGDLSFSDEQGTDFSKLDESKECFDTKQLAVGATKDACKNPL